ncbi:MAG: MerR family transcriptional regulator [Gemmatimonadota bacterium]
MTMMIGALADAAGVNVQTIRYYERRGILAKPSRTASGYRIYQRAAADRVRFIKRAQELGFSLAEVESLLELRAANAASCDAASSSAREKLADVASKIDHLERLRRVLSDFVEACELREPSAECPILEALGEDADA